MVWLWRSVVIAALAAASVAAQTTQYTITTIAGGNPSDVAATSVNISLYELATASAPSPAIYITSPAAVYKVDANSVFTVFAGNGTNGSSGYNGLATAAQVSYPVAVSADTSGNVFFVTGTTVNKVDTNGILTAFYEAPQFFAPGTTGESLMVDGVDAIVADGLGSLYVNLVNGVAFQVLKLNIATGAQVGSYSQSSGGLTSLAVDSAGVVYGVGTQYVYKLVGSSFQVIAGNGTNTYVNGASPLKTGLPPNLNSLAVMNSGTSAIVYLTDGSYIYEIASAAIKTIAGNGTMMSSGDGGPASQAGFAYVSSLAVDSLGSLYVADDGSGRVRKISTFNIVSTFAGGGDDDGGAATSVFLGTPQGIAVNSTGTLYMNDGISRIRQVSNGIISTAAGTTEPGISGNGGPATANRLYYPQAVAVDSAGNLYIADTYSCRIRKAVPGGVLTTIAGNSTPANVNCTYTEDGPAQQTGLDYPYAVAVDGADNVYLLDNSPAVRKITGTTITTLKVPSEYYSAIAVDPLGDVYLGDSTNKRVIKLSINGSLSTFVSNVSPAALALDSANNLYIVDGVRDEVLQYANGALTVVAGNGQPGFSGDGGPANEAQLNQPNGLAVDSGGNVYISDAENGRIRVAVASTTQSVPGDVVSLSPGSAYVGTPGLTPPNALAINGTGFTNKSVVLWNGSPIPTMFVSSSKLTATVSAGLLSAAGPATVSVGASNVVNFYVLAPAISSLNPPYTFGASLPFTFTVNGSGFISGVSKVYLDGTPLETTFVSSTQLTATIPVGQSGFKVPVSVFNLTTSSNELIFTLGSPQYFCVGNSLPAPPVRVGGEAELLGDLTLTCISPTGATFSPPDITVQPSNFNFTSRILNTTTGATEALLLVGDPPPAAQVLNSNVFQGFLIGPNIVFPAVPLVPSLSNTTLRIVNLRANTQNFAVGNSQTASVTVNMGQIPVNNAVQTLGLALPTPLAATVSSMGTQRTVQLTYSEKLANVNTFRTRVASGGVQDVPGTAYNTESGFVNPGLVANAGLADTGTRLLVQFEGVPVGVSLFAAGTSDDGVSARLVATDSNGLGAGENFISGSSMFGGSYAPISVSSGTATAVWEVITPSLPASIGFHVVLTGVQQTNLGTISLEGGLAPLSAIGVASDIDPLPRFASDSLTSFVDMTLLPASAAATQTSSARTGGGVAGGPSTSTSRGSPANDRGVVSDSTLLPAGSPVPAGSSVTLSFNLLNNSPAATTQLTVSSNVPPQLTVGPCSAPGGTCNVSPTPNPDGTTSVTALYPGPVQPGEAPAFTFTAMACDPTLTPCATNSTATVSTTVTALNASQQFVNDSFPPDNFSSNSFYIASNTTPPTNVTVQFATNPSGLTVQVGSSLAVVSPSITIIQSGTLPTFQVTTPQTLPDGSQYAFSSWSDGTMTPFHPAMPALLGGGTITANFVAVAATPFVDIDVPAVNATLSGTTTISGWAIESTSVVGNAVSAVTVFVDETQVGTATYGTSRTDVCATYPGRLGCPNVGWTYNLNVSALSAGSHTLKIVATDSAGVSGYNQVSITVAPTIFVPTPPTADSVSPASGIGVSQTFTFKYSSVNGSGYLSTVYGLINGAINSAGGCFVYYLPATNALYLFNDAGSSAAGPLTPGSSSTLANSQCTLNGTGSSASGAGNTLTVAFSITFKPAFSSLQNVYGYASDSGGNVSGWQLLGTWTGAAPLNTPPAADSVSPASGTGVSQTFTFKYSSVNGSGYLSTVYGLINGAINSAGGCFVYYLPATNALYLFNDAGSSAAGPLTPGSSSTLANSQCTLNGTGSSASSAGNILTVAFSITFKPAFSSLQNVYGYASDSGGNVSGWQLLGTWTGAAPLNTPPAANSVSPASGTGVSQTFTFKYSSVNGSGYLSTVYGLINGAINSAGGCFVYYVPATNALYLFNDSGSSAEGPLTPGSSSTLANSQCTLNGTGSSASSAGNILTVAFSITFKPAFSSLQNVYGYASDSGGNVSGWQLLGTWTGAAPLPAANSVSPASGIGVSQTFTFKYSSVNGSGYLSTVYGLINGAINSAGGCFVYYVPAANALYLFNDAGSSAAGPLTPGSGGTLANSQCTLNGTGSSASSAGNTLTVAFSITFKPAFSSLQNVYGYASDSGGNVSGWQLLGTWTGAAPLPAANSVSPASGIGISQTFTFKYSSVNGSGYLSTVYGLINGAINSAGGCFVYYVPAANALYLYNDVGSSAAGPLAPGSGGTLANSQCTLNGTGSSASGAGNTLTVAFSITFKPAFSSLQNVYGFAADSGGNVSGWQLLGTWTGAAPLNTPPTANSVSPASGTGVSQTFTFKYSSVNGSGYLSTVYGLINGAINAAGGCFVYYLPATNALYLFNDSGSSAEGPLTPGSSSTLANSQCTLNGTGSSASSAGNILTVAFSITFKPAFSSLQNVYGFAADSGGNVSGWQLLGTWTGAAPLNTPPTANSVSPASGTGVSQTFTFKYSSVNGSGYLSTVYGLINGAINGAGGCFVYYMPATNALYLYNDVGSSAAGPLAPGSGGTLANSQCTLNGTGSSASGAGNTLTVAFSITFKPAFSSLQNVYGFAADSGGNVSGWQLLGTWTGAAPLNTPPTANSVSPASGTGVSQTFTFKYSSVNGSGYLSTVYGLINGAINAAGGCFVYYLPATNALYLFNDSGSSAEGPLTPGSSSTLANSQCTLNGTGSSASGAGNTLTVAFSITFKPAFSSLQNVYGYASDSGGNVSGWQLLGTWTP